MKVISKPIMSYTPIPATEIGQLPDIPGNSVPLDFGNVNIPSDATEVLIYSFATTHDASATFRRLYYEMFTTGPDGIEYKQYMNIAAGPNVAINSENMWFPVTNGSKSCGLYKDNTRLHGISQFFVYLNICKVFSLNDLFCLWFGKVVVFYSCSGRILTVSLIPAFEGDSRKSVGHKMKGVRGEATKFSSVFITGYRQ